MGVMPIPKLLITMALPMIASMLVQLLRNDVLAAGRLPYYGTSISHLESQRVALRAGFLPAWFELVAAPANES